MTQYSNVQMSVSITCVSVYVVNMKSHTERRLSRGSNTRTQLSSVPRTLGSEGFTVDDDDEDS